MGGKTIITSREEEAVGKATQLLTSETYQREDKTMMILWKFKNADSASKYAKHFMNYGFEYVQVV